MFWINYSVALFVLGGWYLHNKILLDEELPALKTDHRIAKATYNAALKSIGSPLRHRNETMYQAALRQMEMDARQA
ncbi:hypothetical protein [Ferrimonas balearica]|uniref:hypothetical protein n=1 Tax=Ferrimonas balearica TaxID=44012 RepID=UPI001C96832E|nr:hypothetical protein [Ferrimonas balearica]MBY5980915.1 hypothetical protein [Ferrimonas balearica]